MELAGIMADNAKVSRLARTRNNIARFFREMRTELKKVVWPTGKQLRNSTITVLLCCLFIGVIIWIADFILGQLVSLTLLG